MNRQTPPHLAVGLGRENLRSLELINSALHGSQDPSMHEAGHAEVRDLEAGDGVFSGHDGHGGLSGVAGAGDGRRGGGCGSLRFPSGLRGC